jgi:hypothetical protein
MRPLTQQDRSCLERALAREIQFQEDNARHWRREGRAAPLAATEAARNVAQRLYREVVEAAEAATIVTGEEMAPGRHTW